MFLEKTVLIVDDDAFSRTFLKRCISDDYNVIEAKGAREAFDILLEVSVEISAILVDLIMPEIDGFTFIEMLKGTDQYSNTPIIVITGSNDVASETKALGVGAWDYVTKPYNANILKFRIKNAIDRSQLTLYKEFKHKVDYDELTELYQRNKFYEEVEALMKYHPETQFAMCRIDIDHFKMYNSYFGMAKGDKLLCFVAQQLRLGLVDFETGVCGRIEDDIFGFFVPYDLKKIKIMLDNIKNALLSFNRGFDIVPSVGIYQVEDPSMPVSMMYDSATLAAKTVKGNYTDYYAIYNPKLRDDLVKEQEIINEMRSALKENQFVVYLQPKWNSAKNRPVAAEALVRWNHPEKGIISPGVFIPIFEKNGFISKLDYYIWEAACKILRKWKDESRHVFPISVNVSRINFYNAYLADIIIELVKRYGVDPVSLHLEITESAYTDNPELMLETIKKLHAAGFKISMDDFGSGYSSLNTLKDIYIDELKMDMKFFSKGNEERGAKILEAVVNMARTLEIPVIAEGVETKESVEFLSKLGCYNIQGYYYAKPMPLKDFEEFVDKAM